MLKDLRDSKEFPRPFWFLMGATLIDQTGRFLLVPFFGLYITHRFSISMTQLGQLYLIWALFGILGSFISGAITDRIGRKVMVVAGLVFSAAISLFLGFAENVQLVFGLAALVGLLSDIGTPAQSAMIGDLLPAHRHADGFSIWRVVTNVAAVIGPLLAGLLVGPEEAYLRLFVADAVLSTLTAVLIWMTVPETRPESPDGVTSESWWTTAKGYGRVLGDFTYMAFIIASVLPIIAYAQMNTTMPVYMRDIGGIPPEGYSYLLAINAAMVVFLQMWVTRRLRGSAPMLVMAFGALLYGVGFGVFGFTSQLWLLALAMVVITFGELVGAPVGQALAIRFAPDYMRGRYQAMYSFSWTLPFAIGPYMAGWVWDSITPQTIWYGALLLGLIGALAFVVLHFRVGQQMGKVGEEQPAR